MHYYDVNAEMADFQELKDLADKYPHLYSSMLEKWQSNSNLKANMGMVFQNYFIFKSLIVLDSNTHNSS